MRVVVVEDEPRLRRLLVDYLRDTGYAVTGCADGDSGLTAAGEPGVDAVVLDWMLPGRSGLDLLRELRRAGSEVPVVMLTARGTERDRIGGLDSGADDYLVKPFSLGELAARLRALQRRWPPEEPTDGRVECGDLVLDLAARRVWRGAVEIRLSERELELLRLLVEAAGSVVSRSRLLDELWGGDQRSNIVDAHVKNLRAKLDRPFDHATIHTVRGRGYRFDPA